MVLNIGLKVQVRPVCIRHLNKGSGALCVLTIGIKDQGPLYIYIH